MLTFGIVAGLLFVFLFIRTGVAEGLEEDAVRALLYYANEFELAPVGSIDSAVADTMKTYSFWYRVFNVNWWTSASTPAAFPHLLDRFETALLGYH